jgi:hypothetical protein
MRSVWTLLLLALPLGCLEEPRYQCQSDDVCFFKGFAGVCDLATATCAYQSVDCQGLSSVEGWVNARGLCVPAPNSSAPASTTGDSAGGVTSGSTSSVVTSTSTTEDPTEDESSSNGLLSATESSTGTAPSESTGTPETTGVFGPCDGLSDDITNEGMVTASTTFNGDFVAALSVDGSTQTSWFSTGPEGGGGPSVYSWSSAADRCINRIEVDDNSMHSNNNFREDFGFSSVDVLVLQDDIVVFEETVALPNSPDGPFAVDTGGLIGSRVLLELGGHENTTCGGFSELRVIGGVPRG